MLFADRFGNLPEAAAGRDVLREEEADEVEAFRGPHFLADDHEIRCRLVSLERTLDLIVIGDRDPVEADAARRGDDVGGIAEAVLGVTGVHVEIDMPEPTRAFAGLAGESDRVPGGAGRRFCCRLAGCEGFVPEVVLDLI